MASNPLRSARDERIPATAPVVVLFRCSQCQSVRREYDLSLSQAVTLDSVMLKVLAGAACIYCGYEGHDLYVGEEYRGKQEGRS